MFHYNYRSTTYQQTKALDLQNMLLLRLYIGKSTHLWETSYQLLLDSVFDTCYLQMPTASFAILIHFMCLFYFETFAPSLPLIEIQS